MAKKNQLPPLPDEFKNVARIEDVSALEEKVDKCYSQERYQIFEETVEKIVIKTLGSKAGQKEVKETAVVSIKEYMQQDSSQKKNFWIPVGISIVSTLAAIGAIIVAIFKH